MKLVVDGQGYTITGAPDRTLLWVLRDELGLTGTKFGCGVGICGACEIQVDGELKRSCITSLSEVSGQAVRTIEGLARDGELHPVQQAFLDERVHQCGWCMSGQMMRAVTLLETNPVPTEAEIVSFMRSNYCRCGTYGRILRAVARAAQSSVGGGGES